MAVTSAQYALSATPTKVADGTAINLLLSANGFSAFIGPSTVTSVTGFPLKPDTPYPVTIPLGSLWAIAPTGVTLFVLETTDVL